MENTSFRLISEILAFVKDDQLFISSPDNKSCLGKVKKLMASFGHCISACKELTINPENFKVRLSDNFQFLVANKDLPGGLSKYYKLKNLDCKGDYLTELFNNADFYKGDWNNSFEIAIRDSDCMVRLLCPDMPSFESASDEMIRIMNCKIYKKTRKFIPGHRYDTEDSTIYYIGKVYSHSIGNINNSEYYNIPTEETYLYITEKGNATKLSEILRNGVIDNMIWSSKNKDIYPIKSTNNLKTMVDSGEVFEDDLTCFEDYIPEILENSINYYKNPEYNIRTVLDIFRYNSQKGVNYIYKEDIIYKVTDFIKQGITKSLYRYWDLGEKSRYSIDPNKSIEEQSLSLSSIFINNIIDSNLKKSTYYKQLFSNLGINLDTLSKEILNTWNPSVLKTDFEIYSETSNCRGTNYSIQLRTEKSCKYKLDRNRVSDFILNQDLKDLIFDLIKYIRNNGGYGASSYNIINAGNSSRPLMYEQIVIDIDDIINYHKEKGIEMPENLKYSIIEDKLHQLSISVDLGGDIE